MTKGGWQELTEKQKWDIQVALRGPDCSNSETIKWFSTSVIRGQMMGVIRVGGTVNEDLKLIIVPSNPLLFSASLVHTLGEEFKLLTQKCPWVVWWSPHHFFEHVMTAAQHLSIPVGMVQPQTWLDAVKHGVKGAGKLFLTDLTSHGDVKGAEELKRHLTNLGGIYTHEGEE